MGLVLKAVLSKITLRQTHVHVQLAQKQFKSDPGVCCFQALGQWHTMYNSLGDIKVNDITYRARHSRNFN